MRAITRGLLLGLLLAAASAATHASDAIESRPLQFAKGANYFNVLPPGSNHVAIFVGSTEGNDWTGTLPADGEYAIRVYLMRSAARRNEVASYTLDVSITGSGAQASALGKAPASDAMVPGTKYHATSIVPCSLGAAPRNSSQCDVGG